MSSDHPDHRNDILYLFSYFNLNFSVDFEVILFDTWLQLLFL